LRLILNRNEAELFDVLRESGKSPIDAIILIGKVTMFDFCEGLEASDIESETDLYDNEEETER
jgi:hypothetical protein